MIASMPATRLHSSPLAENWNRSSQQRKHRCLPRSHTSHHSMRDRPRSGSCKAGLDQFRSTNLLKTITQRQPRRNVVIDSSGCHSSHSSHSRHSSHKLTRSAQLSRGLPCSGNYRRPGPIPCQPLRHKKLCSALNTLCARSCLLILEPVGQHQQCLPMQRSRAPKPERVRTLQD